MNINNSVPLQNIPKIDWKGLCIWNKEASRIENLYCKFRKEFNADVRSTLKIDITADTYFNLYIDGEFFARGPARGHLESYFYEHYEVLLEKGKHLIEVIVHNFGIECATHRKGKGCLLAGCFFEEQNLSTDSTWQSSFLSGYKKSKDVLSHFGFQENVDMSELKNVEYTDAFVLGDYSSASFTNLLPSRIKKFKYSYVNFESICSGKTISNKEYEDFFETVCKYNRKIIKYEPELPFTAENKSFIVFGLDKTYSGTVLLKVTGQKGRDVYISFDDQLSTTGLVNPGRTYARYVDRYTLDNGENFIETILPRGFKYIMIDLPENTTLINASVRVEEYPFDESAAFESSDLFLNQLYKQSILTTKTCTIDGFTDCVTRERVLWMQDLYIDSLNVFYSLNDYEIVKQMMFMFAQGQKEDGRIITYAPSDITWCANPPGTFMWMNLLVDYINFTGDVQSVEKLLPTLERLLEFIQSHTNDDGLIYSWYGSQFWDWSYNEQQGIMTITNAYYAYTLDRMLDCETLRDTVISIVKTSKALIKMGVDKILKNEDGLYAEAVLESGEKSSVVSQLANGVVLLSNIANDEESRQIAEKIVSKENLGDISIGEISINEFNRKKFNKIVPVGTMAGAMLVCQGLFEHNLTKEALQYIFDIWSPYHKAETIQEMRINGDNNTVCHGWSAAPAFLLPMYILGLRPVAKGWEKTVLSPQIADLGYVKGEVTTPKGKIKVEINNNIITISIPKSIELEINYLGEKLTLTECEELSLDILDVKKRV